jgi:hypothetical protein
MSILRSTTARRLTRLAALVATLGSVAALDACGEDRERLDVPRVYLEVDTNVVAPGDSVRGLIAAGDNYGGILRLAARICIDSAFQTAHLSYDRADSASFRFLLPIPASTPQNTLVIVEGQVNDEQNFFVITQDTIIARSTGVPAGPSPRQPACIE